jgi:hypothetical protein
MPREQVGDAQRYARLPAGARQQRCGQPRIHRVARRIGNSDHRITITIRTLRQLLAKLERIRPKEKTDLHLVRAHFILPPAHSRRFASAFLTARTAAEGRLCRLVL